MLIAYIEGILINDGFFNNCCEKEDCVLNKLRNSGFFKKIISFSFLTKQE